MQEGGREEETQSGRARGRTLGSRGGQWGGRGSHLAPRGPGHAQQVGGGSYLAPPRPFCGIRAAPAPLSARRAPAPPWRSVRRGSGGDTEPGGGRSECGGCERGAEAAPALPPAPPRPPASLHSSSAPSRGCAPGDGAPRASLGGRRKGFSNEQSTCRALSIGTAYRHRLGGVSKAWS